MSPLIICRVVAVAVVVGISSENVKDSKPNDNKMSNMKGMSFITVSNDSSESHLTI